MGLKNLCINKGRKEGNKARWKIFSTQLLRISGHPSAGRELDNITHKEHQTKYHQGPSDETLLAPERQEEKDGKYNK
jgi:hypothetical protein